MSSRAREHFRRVVFALFGGGVMTAAAAVFETMSARAVGDLDAPFAGSFAITLGLLAPLGLVTSVFIAAAVAVLSPDSPASFSLWMEKLRGLGDKRQADLAAFVPLAVIAGFAWMTTSAHVARAILSMSVSAGLAGIGVTAGSLAVGLCLAISTLAAVPVLRRVLARLSATRRWRRWRAATTPTS